MMKFVRSLITSILKNLRAIIYAVVISTVIWFAISLQLFPDVLEHVADIPVAVNLTDFMKEENLFLVNDNTDNITIQIKGKRYEIGQLNPADFNAYLDLSEVTDRGDYQVGIVVDPVDPSICEVVSPPLRVNITVEKTATKEFTLKANVSDVRTTSGLSIDVSNVEITPNRVTLTGVKSVIDSIERAEVLAAESELASTAEVRGTLVLYNNMNLRIDDPDVTADVTGFAIKVPVHKIKTLPLEYSVTGAPSNFDLVGLLDKMTIYPKELTISSPDNSIDNLTTLNIGESPLSELNYKYLQNGINEPIAGHLTDGYVNISNNNSVAVRFTGVDDYYVSNFTVPKENISIINVPEQYSADLLTNELAVQVLGPPDFVQSMTAGDITATVNLLGQEITEEVKPVNVSFRISGEKVPAWVVGTQQVNISFKSKQN